MENNLEAVETAGEPAADAPGHTPEPQVDEVDAVEEAVETESDDTPEATETEESVESEDDSPVVEDFSDLEENFIPTDEEIAKLRIPKQDRERLAKVAAKAREFDEKFDSIGGDFGIQAFAPFAKALTKANITAEDQLEIVGTLAEANGTVAYQVFANAAQNLLNHPTASSQILQAVFGENATVENVKTLLKLDKEGAIDKDWSFDSENPELVRLREENAELKAKAESSQPTDQRGERASKDFETDFYAEIPQQVKQFFERAGWDLDGSLAKLVVENLTYQLKTDQRYKDTDDFVRQTGTYRDGDRRVGMADANLMLLKNLAKSRGLELVKAVQQEFKKISEKSRNRVIKEQQKAKSEVVTAKPQPLPVQNETFKQRQARLKEEYLAAIAQ